MVDTPAIPPYNPSLPDTNITDQVAQGKAQATQSLQTAAENIGVQDAKKILAAANASATAAPNSSTFAQMLTSQGIKFNPVPNPLNTWANYTYHIRFSLTSDQTAYTISTSNPRLDNLPKTVIAESGVTAGFNITSFEIDCMVGPNHLSLNTQNIGWRMTIVEPYGLSLMDKILSAAVTQPVVNYLKAPYFIDVWFNGYDEDGNIQDPNQYYKLYRVAIQNMNAKVTEAGTTYEITGIFDNGIGYSNLRAVPYGTIEIAATTLGEFFTSFKDELNLQWLSLNERNFALSQFDFVLPKTPDMANWKLKPSRMETHNSANADPDIAGYENGKIKIKVTQEGVEQIINSVISLCEDDITGFIQGTRDAATRRQDGTSIEDNAIGKWIMVHSTSVITGYDPMTRDYTYKITYTLVPYDSTRAFGDIDTVQKMEAENAQKKKLNMLIDNNALVKEYDYIYTGLNTEVIRFDIDINNMWAISLPQWEGTQVYDNWTGPPIIDTNTKSYMYNKGMYSKYQQIDEANARLGTIDADIAFANSSYEESLKSADKLAEEKKNLLQTAYNLTHTPGKGPSDQVIFNQANNTSPGGYAVDAVKPSLAAKQEAAKMNYLAKNAAALRYAEDVGVAGSTAEPIPITIRTDNDPQTQNTSQGADSNKAMSNLSNPKAVPSGRGFIGSILGNLFNPSFLLKIQLEIRGDPYWLGQSNIKENEIAASVATSTIQTVDRDYANYLFTDHLFVLSFRTGENYNEETGLMEFTTSQFVNGVYAVLQVTNTFREGKFTQTLIAGKDVFTQKIKTPQKITSNAGEQTNAAGQQINSKMMQAISSTNPITPSTTNIAPPYVAAGA